MLVAASDRVFRSYFVHCSAPEVDYFFNYLNAIHSFNDKLPKEYRLFDSREFVGLKALRNLFHHHKELLADVKIFPAKNIPVAVELMHVCLFAAELIERAAVLPRERQPEVVRTVFNRYGDFCDIEPAIFNATVDVFEVSTKLLLAPANQSALFEPL